MVTNDYNIMITLCNVLYDLPQFSRTISPRRNLNYLITFINRVGTVTTQTFGFGTTGEVKLRNRINKCDGGREGEREGGRVGEKEVRRERRREGGREGGRERRREGGKEGER